MQKVTRADHISTECRSPNGPGWAASHKPSTPSTGWRGSTPRLEGIERTGFQNRAKAAPPSTAWRRSTPRLEEIERTGLWDRGKAGPTLQWVAEIYSKAGGERTKRARKRGQSRPHPPLDGGDLLQGWRAPNEPGSGTGLKPAPPSTRWRGSNPRFGSNEPGLQNRAKAAPPSTGWRGSTPELGGSNELGSGTGAKPATSSTEWRGSTPRLVGIDGTGLRIRAKVGQTLHRVARSTPKVEETWRPGRGDGAEAGHVLDWMAETSCNAGGGEAILAGAGRWSPDLVQWWRSRGDPGPHRTIESGPLRQGSETSFAGCRCQAGSGPDPALQTNKRGPACAGPLS